MSEFKTVATETESVTVIERSKFICLARGIDCEEDVKDFLAFARKKYPLANHYCYAFVADEKGLNQKFSDDGEPHGTAGLPILNAINGRGLVKTAVVVVRYFGGIKLGTGGLSRAYGGCAAETLDGAQISTLSDAEFYYITMTYPQHKKATTLLTGAVIDTEFGEAVRVKVAVKAENDGNNSLITGLKELFNNDVKIESAGKGLFEFKI